MKRTKFWERRLVLAGIAVSLMCAAVMAIPQTRGIVLGYFETEQAMREIRTKLNPQSEFEFICAISDAVMYETQHQSVFSGNAERIVDCLMRNRDGTIKPWATDELRQHGIRSIREGGWEYYPPKTAASNSYICWKYSPYVIWIELGSILVGAAGVFWFGMFLLPFLAVLCLAVLLNGKTGHRADIVVHDPTRVEILQQTDGGSGGQVADTSHAAAIVPAFIWPIVLFIAVTIRPSDYRKMLLRSATTWRSRAPPIERKGCLMLRQAVLGLLFVSLFVLPASAGQTVQLQFGEWVVARGSSVETRFETRHWGAWPFLFLDGSRYECTGYFKMGSAENGLLFGPALGSLNLPAGARMTGGGEFRGVCTRWGSALSWRLAARYRGSQRLFHIVIIGVERTVSPISLRISYQPIRRLDSWEQRFALRVTVPTRFCKLGLEARMSTDDSRHRTTAHAEVSIPLP